MKKSSIESLVAVIKKFHLSLLPNSTYIFLIVFVVFSLSVDNFFSPANLSNLLLQASVLVIISLGMSIVIMTGGIDLSIGGIISMCGVITAIFMREGISATISIFLGILIGALYGLMNGFIVQKMKVTPFIATFGSMGIAQSIANTFSTKRTVYWKEGSQSALIRVLQEDIFRIELGTKASEVISFPYIVLICIIVTIIIIFLFRNTVLGAYVYAIGANEETARLSGINTTRWKMAVYSISGMLAAIAAVLLLIRTNSAQPTIGDGLEFQAVVASVIGGNNLKGGKGSLSGAILGAFALYSVRSALSLSGVSTFVVMVVIGGVLIIGMLLNELIAVYEERKKFGNKAKKAIVEGAVE